MSTFALLEKGDLVVAVFRRKGKLQFLTLLPNQLDERSLSHITTLSVISVLRILDLPLHIGGK
jgi:hypothetical protein